MIKTNIEIHSPYYVKRLYTHLLGVVIRNEELEEHMVNKLKQTDNYFPHFLLLFIVFQPILDLLTSFSIYILHMSATVGVVVRFAFMLLALGYLLLHHKQQDAKKYILYLCLLGIALAIGLVNNMMVKSPISFGEEVKLS